jgi:predicted kinase
MTQELRLTRGLPGSGKSTFADQWLAEDPENRVRVNRDTIRFELYNMWYPVEDEKGTVKEKEARVSEVEYQRIEKALNQGKSVIVDNTNLNPMSFSTYGKIARRMLVPLTHTDFPISIEETLRRNSLRERQVPEFVIRDMQAKYMGPNGEFHLFPGDYPIRPFKAPKQRKQAAIFDADGTLVDIRSVRHFLEGKVRDFDSFHRSSLWSPPNAEVVALAKRFYDEGLAVLVTTAREDKYREVTQAWVDREAPFWENIYTRPTGDQRPDAEVKAEILKEIQKHYDVVHAVDDRPSVLDHHARAGPAAG